MMKEVFLPAWENLFFSVFSYLQDEKKLDFSYIL